MVDLIETVGSESKDCINTIFNVLGDSPLGVPLLFFVTCIVIYIGIKTVKRVIDMLT